jgi:predicted CopG family antitoxin
MNIYNYFENFNKNEKMKKMKKLQKQSISFICELIKKRRRKQHVV